MRAVIILSLFFSTIPVQSVWSQSIFPSQEVIKKRQEDYFTYKKNKKKSSADQTLAIQKLLEHRAQKKEDRRRLQIAFSRNKKKKIDFWEVKGRQLTEKLLKTRGVEREAKRLGYLERRRKWLQNLKRYPIPANEEVGLEGSKVVK